MFLPLLAFFYSCGNSTDEKELELLKKENELLKREQKLNYYENKPPKEKVKPFDWSGQYSVYSDDVDYNAKVYNYGTYKVILTATGRQTNYSITCDCVSTETLLKCFYKETKDGAILGDFDATKPIFVLKKLDLNSFQGYFNKFKIDKSFLRTQLPIDTLVF